MVFISKVTDPDAEDSVKSYFGLFRRIMNLFLTLQIRISPIPLQTPVITMFFWWLPTQGMSQ